MMLNIIKFLIWMGKDSALKELYNIVKISETCAFNNYLNASEHKDEKWKSYYDAKSKAYNEVLDTIKLIMEREENGKKNLK